MVCRRPVFINPTWYQCIILGSTLSKCKAKIFVRILQSRLIKLTGLELEGSVVSLSFLGITEIKALLHDGGRNPSISVSL